MAYIHIWRKNGFVTYFFAIFLRFGYLHKPDRQNLCGLTKNPDVFLFFCHQNDFVEKNEYLPKTNILTKNP